MSESMHNLRMEGTAQRVADGDLFAECKGIGVNAKPYLAGIL